MSDRAFAAQFNKQRNLIASNEWNFNRIFNLHLKDYYGSNALDIAVFGFDVFKFSDDISERHCGGQDNWSEVDSPFSLEEIVLLEYKQEGLDMLTRLTV